MRQITEVGYAALHPIKLVCVEEKPKVEVSDFISVLERGFERHRINTIDYRNKAPARCEYNLVYTATRAGTSLHLYATPELRLHLGRNNCTCYL